jgi:hypothetical protein
MAQIWHWIDAMKRQTLVGLLTLSLAVGGCNVYACKYETRFVATRGSASSAAVGNVTVEYMNFRDYDPEETALISVSYVAKGEGLTAAPTRLTLRDARDLSRIVSDLGMQSSAVSFSAGSGFAVASAERNSIFELLASGNGRVILELSNGNSLTVPLTVTTREDWHRPSCD